MKRYLVLLVLLAGLGPAVAAIDAFPFEDPEKEASYHQLISELRCLVCQNQSLEDSNAELALDLRRQVYRMLNEGKSRQEVADYMVARYGDFVLYRPPVRPATYLLWFGPVLLLLVGSIVLFRFVRRRVAEAASEPDELSPAERKRLAKLLQEEKGGRG